MNDEPALPRIKPVPPRLYMRFIHVMREHEKNLDDLSDADWFNQLTNTAKQFLRRNRLDYSNAADAVHQYVQLKQEMR